MGAWGTGIFQDDFACDLRDHYQELAALQFDDAEILAELQQEHGNAEGIDASTFWIALALLQHKLGRLTAEIRDRACGLIDSGQALRDWIDLTEEHDPTVKSRARQLQKSRAAIVSPQPPVKRPRPSRELRERIDRTYEPYEWKRDHLYAYHTQAGEWIAFVASEVHSLKLRRHYAKRGTRYVRVESPELLQPYLLLLNYRGKRPPAPQALAQLSPYLAPASDEERQAVLECVDQVGDMWIEEAAQTFEAFEAQNPAMRAGMTGEQLRARYVEYTDYCRKQAVRFADRGQARARHFHKRYMLDPRVPVPTDRLKQLATPPRRIDCEILCTSANWDTLEACLTLPGLGRRTGQ